MTQEDKELLLKDLCVRLPYRVICHIEIHYMFTGYVEKGDLTLNSISIKDSKCDFITCWGIDIDYVRPYLRPMSSMTEEEKRELTKLVEEDLSEFAKFITEGHGLSHDGLYMFDKKRQLDWLLKNHFDFRGLLPKGLALEAPEGMYNV